MLRYRTFEEIKAHDGLRIVLVQGMPSPWGQAAKTIFEIKKLDYVAAPYVPFAANPEIASWGGEDSAPIVAWRNEKPIHRWVDILHLSERLAPTPSLIPADGTERALMFGLANELCGELGIGWNRRLQMLAQTIESSQAPEAVVRMGGKYGYRGPDARAAGARIASSLRALAMQLEAQYARGIEFFVGAGLSALDVYWVAFANLLAPLPKEHCPMPEEWRPAFVATDPQITRELTPLLLRHRDAVFAKYFRDPMEL